MTATAKSPDNYSDDFFESEDEVDPKATDPSHHRRSVSGHPAHEDEAKSSRLSASPRLLARRDRVRPAALLSPGSQPKSDVGRRSCAGTTEPRVPSAVAHQRKERANAVFELRLQVHTLDEENRLLQRQLKRQTVELDRLAGARGELPTILSAHNEEVRAVKERLKKSQLRVCELEKKLKSRDLVLQRCREEARSIKALAKDKSLHSRQTLAKELEETKEHLTISDCENKDLRAKLNLFEKNFKRQLSSEREKRLDLQKNLEEAENKIIKLLEELLEKERALQRTNIYSRRQQDPNPTSATEGKAKAPAHEDNNNTVVVTNEKGHKIKTAKKQPDLIKTSLYSHPSQEDVSAKPSKPPAKIESSTTNASHSMREAEISKAADKTSTNIPTALEVGSKNKEPSTANYDFINIELGRKGETEDSEAVEADFLGDLVDADRSAKAPTSNHNFVNEEEIHEEDSAANVDLIRDLVNMDSELSNDDKDRIEDTIGDFVDSEIANAINGDTKSDQSISPSSSRQTTVNEETSHAEQRRKGFLKRNGTINILVEKGGEQSETKRADSLSDKALDADAKADLLARLRAIDDGESSDVFVENNILAESDFTNRKSDLLKELFGNAVQ